MSLYNFIYCFIYKLSAKRWTKARFLSAGTVLFSFLVHMLLILSLVRFILNSPISGKETNGLALIGVVLMIVIGWLALNRFYSLGRTRKLLKVYRYKYGFAPRAQAVKVLLITLLPCALLAFFASVLFA